MLIIDTHVHVYPHYDCGVLLHSFLRNTRGLVQPEARTTLAVALVERSGVDLFSCWREGQTLPPGSRVETLDKDAIRIRLPDHPPILVLAGCQIACRERIEILGLGCRIRFRDGMPAAEAIEGIEQAGGLPVLAWGVGKWMLKRSRTVRSLFSEFPPERMLIGDSSLRPIGWPEPWLMRRERRMGRRILAGSDPLPPFGEERMAGRYVTLLETSVPETGGITGHVLAALRDPEVRAIPAGRRSSPVEFLRRR